LTRLVKNDWLHLGQLAYNGTPKGCDNKVPDR
jgi:hypothetical protein